MGCIINNTSYTLSIKTTLKKKTLRSYLNNLKKKEKQFCQLHNVQVSELKKIYQVMLFADRCSLILCQDSIPKAGRFLEINKSIQNEKYWIKELNNSSPLFTIEPWIFQKQRFQVQAEYKLLTQPSFSTNNEFEKEYFKADVKMKEWSFKH